MPLFAPGAWAGVNDSFLIARQREQEQQRLAEGQARMKRDAYDMMTTQQDRQANDGAANGIAGFIRNRPMQPLQPLPGQGSQPMQPPGGPQVGAPQGPPRMPQGSPLPPMGGGQPPPMQPQGMPQPGQRSPMPNFPPPDPAQLQNEQVERTQKYIADIQQEMRRPGIPGDTTVYLRAELAKTQDYLSKLTGQAPPYRTVPDGSEQPAQAQQGPMAPPALPSNDAKRQVGLIDEFLSSDQAKNMEPRELMAALTKMKPIVDMHRDDETLTIKFQNAELAAYRAMNSTGVAWTREGRLERQGDQRIEQSGQRITLAKEKAAAGAAPTKSELDDPDTARIFFDVYKTTGKMPPFSMGMAGKNDREAWMRVVKQYSQEDKLTGGEIAGGQADAKANSAALVQNTKQIANIRPFKEMLDLNIDVAKKLAEKVNLANSQWGNQSVQWLEKNATSNPALRDYLVQVKLVMTEATRVINTANLNGVLSDTARKEIESVFNGTMPLNDAIAVMNRFKADGDNRVKKLEDENGRLKRGASGKSSDAPAKSDGNTNAKGWTLHTDKNGNKAYVSPDGKQFEEMK